jgi:hypothetical protein
MTTMAAERATATSTSRAPRYDARLDHIRAKVERGERLTLDDGDLLFTTRDVWTVCELADLVRRRLHGDVAYYNINRHLNYSNVCALSCKFCEFYAKSGDDKAYTRDMAYVRDEVRKAVESGATEMHSVGGLHPQLPFSPTTPISSPRSATRPGSRAPICTSRPLPLSKSSTSPASPRCTRARARPERKAERRGARASAGFSPNSKTRGSARSPAAVQKSSTIACTMRRTRARSAPTSGWMSIASPTRSG